MPNNNRIIWFLILPVLVMLDQLTKLWVVNNLTLGETLNFLPSLQFTLAANKGIAFSMLSSHQPLMQYALIAMIAVICITLVVLLIKTPREDSWSRWGIALMIGGALGNLADRILYGHVVDFIDFYIGQWHWYTFNLADAFITVGAVLMAKAILIPSRAVRGKSVMSNAPVKLLLANPRGFCAGVERAIDIVDAALEKFGRPIYVRHEVVHNRFVVENLKQRGAVFVDDLQDIPDGSIVIFSAHGVSQQVREEAKRRQFNLILDATCPLVTKVHMEVVRQSKKGYECVLIGHAGHAEVEGTLGQYKNPQGAIYLIENLDDVARLVVNDPEHLSYVTQTTLSVDETEKIILALKQKFPLIQGPKRDDICYATQNRQDAVKVLAKQSDVVLVVGSVSSSNSNRLRELAENLGTPSYLLDSPSQLEWAWIKDAKTIGVTAGASAPDILVQDILKTLREYVHIETIQELNGIEENMSFSMPKELREKQI